MTESIEATEAEAPEAADQLLDVGDAVERVDDERQPGPILVGARRGPAPPLVRLDTFDHVPVKGMLPHNKLGNRLIRKLKVYAGPEHPHAAQQPVPFEITQIAQ